MDSKNLAIFASFCENPFLFGSSGFFVRSISSTANFLECVWQGGTTRHRFVGYRQGATRR